MGRAERLGCTMSAQPKRPGRRHEVCGGSKRCRHRSDPLDGPRLRLGPTPRLPRLMAPRCDHGRCCSEAFTGLSTQQDLFGDRPKVGQQGVSQSGKPAPWSMGAGRGRGDLIYRRRTEFPPSMILLINAATALWFAAPASPGGMFWCAAAASCNTPTISCSGRILRSFSAKSSDSHMARAADPSTSCRLAIGFRLSLIFLSCCEGPQGPARIVAV